MGRCLFGPLGSFFFEGEIGSRVLWCFVPVKKYSPSRVLGLFASKRGLPVGGKTKTPWDDLKTLVLLRSKNLFLFFPSQDSTKISQNHGFIQPNSSQNPLFWTLISPKSLLVSLARSFAKGLTFSGFHGL